MGSRSDLQTLLVSLLGSNNVYFQPPPSVQMQYPCVIYQRSNLDIVYADNGPYKHKKRYTVTLVDADPDTDVFMKIAGLPLCSYDRFYVADNLNHDVFTLFF